MGRVIRTQRRSHAIVSLPLRRPIEIGENTNADGMTSGYSLNRIRTITRRRRV